MPIRFLTAGESHGPALTVIVEGLPAGLPVDRAMIEHALRRRRGGYGRGGRMRIETDDVEILGGVRHGATLGAPVSLVIRNRDFENWKEAMDPYAPPPAGGERAVTCPRPGHADLAGALKYDTHDARDILERASARETAARTAAGALARCLLQRIGIEITSATTAVGGVIAPPIGPDDFDALAALPDDAAFRCLQDGVVEAMTAEVDRARHDRNSVGGTFEILARGVDPGFGSHVHWDRRLDARIASALISIPAVKAVEIGEGFLGAQRFGSDHHDPIDYDRAAGRFRRPTNRAGGIEGGVSNGESIRATGFFKPLSTLPQPLRSVDLHGKDPRDAVVERTDTTAIVAAGIVGEAMVAWVLADEALRKFGGDTVGEWERNVAGYRAQLDRF